MVSSPAPPFSSFSFHSDHRSPIPISSGAAADNRSESEENADRLHTRTLIGIAGEQVIGFRGERVIGIAENPHYYYLNLFSGFTYYLDDPVKGDQFEQQDSRFVLGVDVRHTLFNNWFGRKVENTFGLQVRND